ncbi:hypothetical protein CFC21_044089 [Triticum aestivum]|uniref:Uncharacterized protein n=3 Tax=Triticum TaxID=4564 RepID=A0A9R1JX96_WHEAT|nr:hypothetical protein CFC21_044089 [Triticum aestivum]CDM86242.1 unnamed protein product [Triticum aestivum]VAH84813.1 unnamed protein product [Triticum turgidum subsp. durum]
MAAPKALICAMIILLGVVGFTCPRASAGRVPSVAPVPVRCASTGESNIVSAGTGGCGGSAPAAAEEKALLPVRLPPRLPPSRENLLKTPPRSIH